MGSIVPIQEIARHDIQSSDLGTCPVIPFLNTLYVPCKKNGLIEKRDTMDTNALSQSLGEALAWQI